MKKYFVIDTDEKLIETIKSLANTKKVEVKDFTSSNTALTLIDIEQPSLILLNLDVSDVSEFIVHDLLKKCNTEYSIPVVLIYSDSSEENLNKYKSLMHKSKDYIKKPISEKKLTELLTEYLGEECLERGKSEETEKKEKNHSPLNDIDKETDSLFDTLLKSSDDSESSQKKEEKRINIEDTIADVVTEDVDEFFVLDEESDANKNEAEETHTSTKKSMPESAIYLADKVGEVIKEGSDEVKEVDGEKGELEDTLKKITDEQANEIEQMKAELLEQETEDEDEKDELEGTQESIKTDNQDTMEPLNTTEKKDDRIKELMKEIESLTEKNSELENEISALKGIQEKNNEELNSLKDALEKMKDLLNGTAQ